MCLIQSFTLPTRYGIKFGSCQALKKVSFQGECVGQLGMLTGEANFYSCSAKERSRVAILTRDTFFEIVCESPKMVLSLAHTVIARLSPLVRQVDFALDWVKPGLHFKCILRHRKMASEIKLHDKPPLNCSNIALLRRNCRQGCICPKYGACDIYAGPFLVSLFDVLFICP